MFFFFNDTATTEIYTLSLHDALPICVTGTTVRVVDHDVKPGVEADMGDGDEWPAIRAKVQAADILVISTPTDRKSTRLNSSHANISYAVFCLKKKKKYHHTRSSTCFS